MADAHITRTGVQWQWCSDNGGLFSSPKNVEWKDYSDVENCIIEGAFASKQTHALLDDYQIDFTHRVQLSNSNSNKQCPVKRVTRENNEKRFREARFMSSPVNPRMPFNDTGECIALFVRETSKNTDLYAIRTIKTRLPKIIECAACGLIIEGNLVGKRREAEWMAEQLRKESEGTYKDAGECCARLYAMESFLYRKLNEVMRLVGQDGQEYIWRDKVKTFGPFAFLLQNYMLSRSDRPNLTIYRGANLSGEMIQSFSDTVGKGYRSFQVFTSGSRNRTKAEH